MSEPNWLSAEALKILHNEGLTEHGGQVGIRDEGLLESAMGRPQNLFAYGSPDLFDLAAAYTYGLTKNHPFLDGNKRAGFLAGAVFLQINGYYLAATPVEATLKMVALASSEITEEDYAAWLRANTEPVAD